MFSLTTHSSELIAEFQHDHMMRYSQFVPRLYNLCRSLGFTPGKIMPSRAFCSDENQGYPVIMLAKHFATFPFNHGIAGGIVATERHGPHAHHGKDLVIIHASHVGYDPQAQTFGTYRRLQTEGEVATPTCGKIDSMLEWYQEEYRFAANNILLRNNGNDYHIVIDNQLLNETRSEGLFLRLDQFVVRHDDGSYRSVRTHSTSKSYRLSVSALELLDKESFVTDHDRRIGRQLKADWFYFKRGQTETNEDRQHLERNLLAIMPQIITSPSPLLMAAQYTTQVEFDRAFRTISKSNAYEARKIFLISGLNIDISPTSQEMFPLTQFIPWAAFYRDENGNTQHWEQVQLVETLRAQSTDNPEQIDLEDVLALMGKTPTINITWPI